MLQITNKLTTHGSNNKKIKKCFIYHVIHKKNSYQHQLFSLNIMQVMIECYHMIKKVTIENKVAYRKIQQSCCK